MIQLESLRDVLSNYISVKIYHKLILEVGEGYIGNLLLKKKYEMNYQN